MKNQDNKKILKKDEVTKKTFSYELDDISFSFILRIDVKKELIAGKTILETAIEDFKKELLLIDKNI